MDSYTNGKKDRVGENPAMPTKKVATKKYRVGQRVTVLSPDDGVYARRPVATGRIVERLPPGQYDGDYGVAIDETNLVEPYYAADLYAPPTKAEMRKQIKNTAAAARKEGMYVRIDRTYGTVLVHLDEDDERFYEDWRADELLAEYAPTAEEYDLPVADVILAAAQSW